MSASTGHMWGVSQANGQAASPGGKAAARNTDYSAAIAKVDSEMEALKPQLQAALDAWLDAAAPWVAKRWEETLETAIAYNPDAVKELGDERRRALKERTTRMIDSPRPHLQRSLVEEQPEAWPHLRDPDARQETAEDFTTKTERLGNRISQTVPGRVSSKLETVLSEMADLLESEGFNLARFLPGSALSRSQRPRVAEGLSLAWSTEMMSTMDAYGRLAVAFGAACRRRESVQAQADRSEAEELWGNS